MRIKTMAIVITPETYNIAIACLPKGFSKFRPSDTYGRIMIINERDGGKYVNSWMKPETFIEIAKYKKPWKDNDMENKFREIVMRPASRKK